MPKFHGRVALALLISVSLSVGCGDSDSPTAPAATALTGTWTGSIKLGTCGGGSDPLRLEISQYEYQGGQFLTGRWEATSSVSFCGDRGSLDGQVHGNNVSLGLGSEVHFACVLVVEATRHGENRLDGHFDRSRCTLSGSLEAVRQP